MTKNRGGLHAGQSKNGRKFMQSDVTNLAPEIRVVAANHDLPVMLAQSGGSN